MNLPVSDIVEQGKKTADFNYRERINQLMDSEFSGYIVVTADGFEGVEEGVLIFRKSYLVASLYELLNYGITVFGDSSLKHVFNALACPRGIVDVYGITTQQVDLVTAFNDKIKLTRPVVKREIPRLYIPKYSEDFSKDLLKEIINTKESKEAVLKKFGLSKLG